VALTNGTFEPAAVPVNHRLPLRNDGLRRQAASISNVVSFSPGDVTVAQELTAWAGSFLVP
jgi:hypothetical protein